MNLHLYPANRAADLLQDNPTGDLPTGFCTEPSSNPSIEPTDKPAIVSPYRSIDE